MRRWNVSARSPEPRAYAAVFWRSSSLLELVCFWQPRLFFWWVISCLPLIPWCVCACVCMSEISCYFPSPLVSPNTNLAAWCVEEKMEALFHKAENLSLIACYHSTVWITTKWWHDGFSFNMQQMFWLHGCEDSQSSRSWRNFPFPFFQSVFILFWINYCHFRFWQGSNV